MLTPPSSESTATPRKLEPSRSSASRRLASGAARARASRAPRKAGTGTFRVRANVRRLDAALHRANRELLDGELRRSRSRPSWTP